MIKIICVGKIKESYLKDAIDEYTKRLSKYTKIEIIEVKDSKIEDKIVALREEEQELLKVINKEDYLISLAIEGKEQDSISFSEKIRLKSMDNKNISFIIGGSYGIPQSIKDISNELLSFSRLTFPHQLFRVLLLEQIYRAYRIINNETYHK